MNTLSLKVCNKIFTELGTLKIVDSYQMYLDFQVVTDY